VGDAGRTKGPGAFRPYLGRLVGFQADGEKVSEGEGYGRNTLKGSITVGVEKRTEGCFGSDRGRSVSWEVKKEGEVGDDLSTCI